MKFHNLTYLPVVKFQYLAGSQILLDTSTCIHLEYNILDAKYYYTIQIIIFNQLLQLCTARTVWSDPVIRPVLICSSKLSTCMVSDEKGRKT